MWKTHIDTIGNKLVKLSGVLNELKHYLPEHVLRILYCSMVQSRLTHGILAWGFYYYSLEKNQNRIIRIIRVANIMLRPSLYLKLLTS